MLLVVLACVLGAFGLLVAALRTGAPVWAWGSVAVSGLAAVFLLVGSVRRRSAERSMRAGASAHLSAAVPAEPESPTEEAALPEGPETADAGGAPAVPAGYSRPEEPSGSATIPSGAATPEEWSTEDSSPTVTMAGTAPPQEPAEEEPGEEAAEPDLQATVASLPDEVLVIDEHPRYHLPGCEFLRNYALIPLPANEAVELGFTPCALCTPVRVLSQRRGAETPS